ncbi:hypothetical protein ACW73L_21345 [Methylolobus aquaticus]|nr:hypothetical protein EWI61_13605 [Methylolobus aquaticus]
MRVTTILVNDVPRAVVWPVDRKALARFLRNGHGYLTEGFPDDAIVTHRDAQHDENARWQSAFRLHQVWGGSDDTFFGIPL